MYGSGNRGDYQPTTRWGPLVVIGAVVVVLTLLVVFLVVAGGGSGESDESPPSAADAPPATNPAADDETTYEQTTAPAAPETTATDDEEEESGGEEADASGTPVSSEGDGPGDSEDQQGSGSGEGPPPEGGAMNEPGGFDPLNKNAKPGDLSETDKGRVRLTVSKFINSVHGYSGEDQTEYVRAIERNIDSTSFYQSPAGEQVKQNADTVGTQGMSAAAALERFEIETTEPEEVVGTAYFVSGESYSRTGEIEGEKTYYKQQITLAPDGEIFKVSGASKRVEGR